MYIIIGKDKTDKWYYTGTIWSRDKRSAKVFESEQAAYTVSKRLLNKQEVTIERI